MIMGTRLEKLRQRGPGGARPSPGSPQVWSHEVAVKLYFVPGQIALRLKGAGGAEPTSPPAPVGVEGEESRSGPTAAARHAAPGRRMTGGVRRGCEPELRPGLREPPHEYRLAPACGL